MSIAVVALDNITVQKVARETQPGFLLLIPVDISAARYALQQVKLHLLGPGELSPATFQSAEFSKANSPSGLTINQCEVINDVENAICRLHSDSRNLHVLAWLLWLN